MANKLPSLLAAKAQDLPYFDKGAAAEVCRIGLSNVAVKIDSGSKNYLVKFAIAPASKPTVFVQANYEKEIANRTANLGLSPEFVHFGAVSIGGRKFPYSVQEFIDGRQMDYKADLPKLAKALAELHSKTHNKTQITRYRALDPKKYLLNYAKRDSERKSSNEIEKMLKEYAENAFMRLENSKIENNYFSLVHNDLTPENILVYRNKAFLIDWGWAMYSASAFDICNALSPFTTSWEKPQLMPIKDAEKFIEIYLKNFDLKNSQTIMAEINAYWTAYSSLLINWIFHEVAVGKYDSKSHYLDMKFIRSAMEHADSMQKMLAKRSSNI